MKPTHITFLDSILYIGSLNLPYAALCHDHNDFLTFCGRVFWWDRSTVVGKDMTISFKSPGCSTIYIHNRLCILRHSLDPEDNR